MIQSQVSIEDWFENIIPMDIRHKMVSNNVEFESFRDAVVIAGLPHEDLDYQNQILISFFTNGVLVGTGGLEIHDCYGLLRSISVSENYRNRSIGKQITSDIIKNASNKNLDAVYLLTETASEYFQKMGFEIVGREDVPDEIKSTNQFANLCPVSAICMVLKLGNE